MTNPVLVEVLRGGIVESRHRGAVCVVDADGRTAFKLGDVSAAVFPRSAVKAIQALPLVESGAADAYGFGHRELALACASHNGEPDHVALARSMLARARLDDAALECGTHWPLFEKAALALAREGGEPSDAHNNCSGKHAGFLCSCMHLGLEHHGYVKPEHAFQEIVREALESVTGTSHNEENRGVDGCSIPTYAAPLTGLALGFARMATGKGMGPERGRAARRLLSACMAEPFFTAGTDRADTALMQAAPGRVFVKTGAEGVYCAAVPELGLGIALKCDDGAGRAAEVATAAVIGALLAGDEAGERFEKLSRPEMRNWNGMPVGSLRVSAELSGVQRLS